MVELEGGTVNRAQWLARKTEITEELRAAGREHIPFDPFRNLEIDLVIDFATAKSLYVEGRYPTDRFLAIVEGITGAFRVNKHHTSNIAAHYFVVGEARSRYAQLTGERN